MPSPNESVEFKNEEIPGLVSIVIVCHDDYDLLEALIPDIEGQTYEQYEVICVLNGSDSQTKEYLTRLNIEYIDPGKNLWYSEGNNRGVGNTRGEYIFILNPDTRLEDDTIEQCVSAAKSHQNAGVLVPKVLSNNSKIIDSVGKRVTKAGWFARIGTGEVDTGQYNTLTNVAAFDGASFLVRRSTINDVGLFDRQYEHYQETNDLSLRIYRGQWDVRVVPESIVHHIGGGSFEKLKEQSSVIHYYGPRNDLITLAKHYNRLYALFVLPIHVLWPVRDAVKLAIGGNPAEANSKIMGLVDGCKIAVKYVYGGISLRDQITLIKDYPKNLL